MQSDSSSPWKRSLPWLIGLALALVACVAVVTLIPVSLGLLFSGNGNRTCFNYETDLCSNTSPTEIIELIEDAAKIQLPSGTEVLYSNSRQGVLLVGPSRSAVLRVPSEPEIQFDARYEEKPTQVYEGALGEALEKNGLSRLTQTLQLWDRHTLEGGGQSDGGSANVTLGTIHNSNSFLVVVTVQDP